MVANRYKTYTRIQNKMVKVNSKYNKTIYKISVYVYLYNNKQLNINTNIYYNN